MSDKKTAILAATFSGNKGAAAMLQSIIKNVSDEVEDVIFDVLSVYPEEDTLQNPYGEKVNVVSCKPEEIIFIAFPLSVLFYLFKIIKPIKNLLLKNKILATFYGSDLVVDAAGISFVDSRGFIMNTYNFICIATPLLLGKKVVKYSQAMGPFKTFWNRLWAKLVLPKVEVICARGKTTKDHLLDLDLKNIELCADGAFNMKDDTKASEYVDSLIEEDIFYQNDVIGVSISSVVDNYCNKNDIDYVDIMSKFANYLNNKGYGVLIIANAARQGKVKPKNNDLIVCQEVYDKVTNKSLCRWYPEEFTPEIIREFISHTKILVASRFHAMIGGLEKKVPVLLIGWSHKYKEVQDMFKIGEYASDYKNLDIEGLKSNFDKLEDEYQKVKDLIEKYIDYVKGSSYKNIKLIIKNL